MACCVRFLQAAWSLIVTARVELTDGRLPIAEIHTKNSRSTYDLFLLHSLVYLSHYIYIYIYTQQKVNRMA